MLLLYVCEEQLNKVFVKEIRQERKRFPVQFRCRPAWYGLLLLFLLALPAQALVVTVDLGWGYNVAGGALLSDYNLQLGSIVQVVMYDSSVYSAPGPDADDNFNITGDNPSNPDSLADTTVYDPESTPTGHLIVYTGNIQAAPYLDDNGNTWWQVYAQFEIIGTYDALYIRVFEATQWSDGTPASSYWGLSDVQYGTNLVGTWYVGPLDEVDAPNQNYFEVIPEPGTFALFVLGGAGLLAGRFRRKKARLA
jgi:hypothetical protein